jgi:predicted CopG family antitoxin
MKTINVAFDDNEFERLCKVKNDESWHDFILRAAIQKVSEAKSK